MPSTISDRLNGLRFGALVVIGAAPSVLQTNSKRKSAVLARCDCGTTKAFIVGNLKSGNSKSCGCQKFEGMKAFNEKRATPQPWSVDGDVATLSICGVKVLVDVADLPLVNKYRWSLNGGYAVARGGRLAMHRLVLGLRKGDPREADHRTQNTFDNRRSCSVRIATSSQNKQNRRGNVVANSRFKGVHYDHQRKRFVAQIKTPERHRFLGRFRSETEAAAAYNMAARKHFGEFAYLNDLGGAQ